MSYKTKETREILKNLMTNGIISSDDFANYIEKPEELMKSILDQYHHFPITKGKGKDKRYVTYVVDYNKPAGRRMIRRSTKSEIYSILMDYYGLTSNTNKTFCTVFKEMINHKRLFLSVNNNTKAISETTIRRYERDYNKYVCGSELDNQIITNISVIDLEKYLADIISQHNIKEKSAKNLLGYICQAFKFACRSRYIPDDPTKYIDKALILAQSTPNATKADDERILSKQEITDLSEAVNRHLGNHSLYMPDYAILLALRTGMRVGELAALHWSDIDDNYIHIDYSEHRVDHDEQSLIDLQKQNPNVKKSTLVIAAPKNNKHRLIPLTNDIRYLLNRIKALNLFCADNFVFVRENGVRYTGHDISCAAERRGSEANVAGRTSIHRIRRTVSSILNTYLPQKVVSDMLGHTEQVNENHYNYSIAETNEKISALESLSSFVIKK